MSKLLRRSREFEPIVDKRERKRRSIGLDKVIVKKVEYKSSLMNHGDEIYFRYENACKILKREGIDTRNKWEEYKSRKGMVGFPKNPEKVYEEFSWKTWLSN